MQRLPGLDRIFVVVQHVFQGQLGWLGTSVRALNRRELYVTLVVRILKVDLLIVRKTDIDHHSVSVVGCCDIRLVLPLEGFGKYVRLVGLALLQVAAIVDFIVDIVDAVLVSLDAVFDDQFVVLVLER